MKIKNGKRLKGWVQKKWEERQVAKKTGYGKAAAREAYEEEVAEIKRETAVKKAREKARKKYAPKPKTARKKGKSKIESFAAGLTDADIVGDMGFGFEPPKQGKKQKPIDMIGFDFGVYGKRPKDDPIGFDFGRPRRKKRGGK